MNTNVQKFSIVKFIILLVCVAGIGSAMAKWDGHSVKEPAKNSAGTYLIANEANLAWFSKAVNDTVRGKKWDAMIAAIDADIESEKYKDYGFSDPEVYKNDVLTLMNAIRENPEAYSKGTEKSALWNKVPYRGYLEKAKGTDKIHVVMDAIIVADYLDMGGYPFTPIAAGQGDAVYSGTFDGNGVTIKNLVVDSKKFEMQFYDVINGYPTYCQNVGFFGVVKGTVKHVFLDGVLIQGVGKSEFDAKWMLSTQVSVGPIAGWLYKGTIETCFASGKVTSYGTEVGAGGIVGAMKDATISNSLSNVTIDAAGQDVYVGGIVGVTKVESGNSKITSCVYDGDLLIAHPDIEGAQGGLAGSIWGTLVVEKSYYDSDVVPEGPYGFINIPEKGNVVDDDIIHGASDVNTAERACILNKGTWTDDKCENPQSSIWSNSTNITNNGVSKDTQGNAVYLIEFDANGGSFAAGAKTIKMLRFGEALTADEIVKPIRDNYAHGGWALTADASAPAADLGKVYKPRKVYAFWKNLYTISFNANGGKFSDAATTKTKKVADGDVITDVDIDAPLDYSKGTGENRKDYKFLGWATEKSATAPSDNLGTATGNKTIFAIWKETQAVFHSVVFSSQGHETTRRVEHNFTVEEPTLSAVRGYTFDGWFKENSFENPFDFSAPIIDDDTIYAKWTLQNYTIAYNLNGGTNDPSNLGTYTVESPTLILKDPTRDGYDFLGWYYDNTYINRATQIGDTTGNISLFAKWSIKTYSITYSAGGTLIRADGDLISVDKIHGIDTTLLGKGYFQAAGYDQDGWSIVDGNESAPMTFVLNAPYTKNEEVYLYPHWKKADYNIIYHNVENAINFTPLRIYQRDTTKARALTEWAANPTMHGYKFEGWYKNADFSGNKISTIAKNEFGDLDLYAKWTPVTITVTAGDNTCPYDGNSCGAKVTYIPKCPTGYTCTTVTNSIKNVAEGPISAKIVSFTIKDGYGNDVTDAFRASITYDENGTISVTPKAVTFKGRDTTATFTGEEIHVSSVATPTGLLPGHTHNVGYKISAIDANTYPATMTAADDVKIFDADGNDVTANYSFTDASITTPTKGLTVEKSKTLTFSVIWADEFAKYADGAPIAMQHEPTVTAIGGTTTYRYQFEGGTWVDELSSLTKTAVGDYKIKVEATNSNYTKKADTTVTLHIDSKPVITITAGSDTKIYDGSPLTKTDGFAVTGELAPGTDEVTDVVVEGSITDVGVAFNKVTGYKVMRGETDVTSNYNFNLVNGTLTVTPAALTIKTKDASKEYDGTALKASDVEVGGLKNEETLLFATSSQTVVGSKENSYEITGGTAKLSNYTITETLGTLTVTPKAVTIKVAAASKLYGDPEPEFTGTPSGLVDNADLGVIKYYRTNSTTNNAGEYTNAITASYTPNSNYSVTVVPANFTIKKRNVTLTSASDSKVYDGSALTAPTVTVGGDGFAPNEGAIFTVTGSQTNAGSSENIFTYKLKDGTDTATNYSISAPVYGLLIVNKAPVTVTIAGHTNSYIYSGAEQKVFGYDVTTSNPLYTMNDFSFNKTETADSIAVGTNVGTYKMGLAESMLQNKNANFNVTFKVAEDGELTITPKHIEVAVGNTSKIYGYPITDSDFKAVTYATGFSENDPIEDLLSKCTYSRTPAGNNVGTYSVSAVCPDYGNYKVTNKPNANNFKITKRSLTLTASAEKTYGEPDPTACTAVISGFVNGDTATVNACTITSRTVAGENIGSYLITATINTSDIKWGETNKDNYTVESGTGLLKINPKEITVTANKASKEYGDPDPTFTYEIEGLVDGDSENLISATITRPSPAGNPLDDDPGEYPISITGEANQGNYKVSFVGSTLEILVENAVIAYWKIGENGSLEKSIIVPIAKSDTTNDPRIISKIRNAITKNHIEPEKAADEDSTYTYNRNWEKIEKGKYKALFRGIAKKTDIIIKYGKNNADTIVAIVEVPRTRDEALISEDIDKALKSRNKEAVKETDNDSTYHVDHWTKNSDGIYEPVFKGTTLTTTIYVSYSDNKYDILPMDIDVHVLPDRNNDSLVWSKAINQVMDSLDLTPTKAGYEFSGIWKSVKNDNYPNGYFEPVFMTKSEVEQLVEKIVVRYGEQPKDTLVLEVPIAASEAHIVTMINDTLTARNITPSKAADGEYGYTFDGTWAKNPTTKQYEPGFTKSKIKEIVVKYGDSDKDTVHVQINESDTDSIIEKKIEAVIIPTKEADSTHVYEFQKFVYNEDTQVYEPSFEYKARMFSVNFNLPSEGELLAEFKGYVYGVVTKLPGARIKSDTTWEFKGWYEKTNGLGERYKAMRATDYGDKDVYPLFQKTVSYDANGNKGAIVVIYSGTAERAINRALAGVIPEDYTKGEKTYTFKEWKQENGVYKAEMTSIPYVRKAVPRFSVTVADRALEISGASIGKTLTVFDMQGRVIVNEQIARGTHRVELAHPGNYIVRVNNQNITVNVK